MRKILRVIDSISEWSGKTGRWFAIIVVLVMVTEVTMRYAFNKPTMWAYESSMMLGAALYAFGFCYTHRYRGHIRVDVFYARLSPRGKAIIDVLGDLLLFFPLVILLAWVSTEWAVRGWKIGETMIETYWYPPAAPLRTVVALGFALFALQGVAQLVRDSYFLVRKKAYD